MSATASKKTRDRWARLSVGYFRDPALITAGPVAEIAFVRLLAMAREQVESAEISGAVPRVLAVRELRDVVDVWDMVNPETRGFDQMITALIDQGLVHLDGTAIVVTNYGQWQTTREEIEESRSDARSRQASSRARRAAEAAAAAEPAPGAPETTPATAAPAAPTSLALEVPTGFTRVTPEPSVEVPAAAPATVDIQEPADAGQHATSPDSGSKDKETEDDMGLYDTRVEAFTDLRDKGVVKKGNRKVGKHGLLPTQVADAEKIVQHLTDRRKAILGDTFRVTDAWWTDTRKLLNGSANSPALTADQICDLIDFALNDNFWHAHTHTPAGLAKHAGKLFASDAYVRWSKDHGRPEGNRPRNTLIGGRASVPARGRIAADNTDTDWAAQEGRF